MSEPEETTPSTPPELSAGDKFMLEAPPFVPRSKRRKALRIEVSQRTYEAVKANPGDLKLIAKDRHGNPVVERPHRPRMTEAQMAERNERLFAERRAEAQAARRPQDPGPSPRDQHWSPARGWDGVTRFVPDNGGRIPFVTHVYDVFDVLRED